MPRLAAEVVAVKACGINGLLPAAFVGGPLPFIPRFALTAPPSAARRPYNSSLENFWGEGLPINMPEDPFISGGVTLKGRLPILVGGKELKEKPLRNTAASFSTTPKHRRAGHAIAAEV